MNKLKIYIKAIPKILILETVLIIGIVSRTLLVPSNCSEKEVKSFIHTEDTLSQSMKDSVINFIYKLRIQHPLIVASQAVLESGNFKSKVYLENNNLFGMKLPQSRPTLAIGVKNGYAVYQSWQESILDYALWQMAYAKNLNEEDYYLKLKTIYAEDTQYVNKVKQVLND